MILLPSTILEVPTPLPGVGLDSFLLQCGILRYDAEDVHRLTRAGLVAPPLPVELYRKVVPPLRLAQAMCDLTGIDLVLGNVYRPEPLNRQVGGAKNSGHLRAEAADVDLPLPLRQDKGAQDTVRMVAAKIWLEHGKELRLGVGFYRRLRWRVHIDLGHPNGWRYWPKTEYLLIRRARAELKAER